jgi:eukaryotic-like serine/threonine-protein kinase
MAYTSDESGKTQAYVRPFPGPGQAVQISAAGGRRPRWRADGKELFYLDDKKVMAVDVRAGTTFESQPAHELFETDGFIQSWDVAADGQRFLLSTVQRAEPFPPITVVVNWPIVFHQR